MNTTCKECKPELLKAIAKSNLVEVVRCKCGEYKIFFDGVDTVATPQERALIEVIESLVRLKLSKV